MILDNRTRYNTADLERLILAGLEEFGVKHAREHVHVVYGRDFSGFCYFPWGKALPKGTRTRKHTGAKMLLRVPRPSFKLCDLSTCDEASRCTRETNGKVHGFDVALFAWLVRHEVGHWRGLRHVQMAPLMRRRVHWVKGIGAEPRSMAPWAVDLTVGCEAKEPSRRKPKPDANDVRAKRIEHVRVMLAKASRRAKLATTLEKKWKRRLACVERAVEKSASNP